MFGRRGRWAERLDGGSGLSRSHGEGFLEVLTAMSAEPGLYVMDEPDSALSSTSCLVLLALLAEMRRAGKPGRARPRTRPCSRPCRGPGPLQFGEDGVTAVDYDESELVTSWRAFLDTPARHLRHLT